MELTREQKLRQHYPNERFVVIVGTPQGYGSMLDKLAIYLPSRFGDELPCLATEPGKPFYASGFSFKALD